MPYKDKEKQREFQRNRIAKRRQNWIDSQGGVCIKCGSGDRLEIDHIDKDTKANYISRMWSYTQERLDIELAKCQVLCYTCHKIKTSAEQTVELVHGTTTAYDKGCKCQLCRDIKAEGMRRSRANRKLNDAG